MNQSQMLPSHFATLFIALFHFISHIQLAMDDVSSETCFVFIEKYKKNDFQKHRGVHQTPFFLLLFTILDTGRYGEKLTKVKKRFSEGENLIDEWSVEFNSQPSKDLKYQRQPSKAYMFTVNRQKLKSIPTVKQLKEHLYLSRLLTKFLET